MKKNWAENLRNQKKIVLRKKNVQGLFLQFRKLRHYLDVQNVVIETDHQPTSLAKDKPQKECLFNEMDVGSTTF